MQTTIRYFEVMLPALLKRCIAATVVIYATGCTDGSDRTEASGNNSSENNREQPVVALVMKSLANEFFVNMAEGAKQHQASSLENPDSGYELIVNGIKNESDLAQQVILIDQMVAAGANAIVIAPADSKAIVPALARAMQKGIVVINIDNKLDSEVLDQYRIQIPFVGPDNRSGSYQVGKYLTSHLSPEDTTAAILEGIPSAFNSQQRRAGFEQALQEDGIELVAVQSAGWDQTRAAEISSALLIQYPELDAILCANDNMALGAASAVEQAGKSGQIKIVGFDNISAARQLIDQGKILATADQHASLLAVYGIEYALEALQGDVSLVDRTTAVDLVTADSL